MPHVAVNYSCGFIVYFIVIATKVVSGQRSVTNVLWSMAGALVPTGGCYWSLLVGSHVNTLCTYIFVDNFLCGILSYFSVSYWYFFGLCCVTILIFAIDLSRFGVKRLSIVVEAFHRLHNTIISNVLRMFVT